MRHFLLLGILSLVLHLPRQLLAGDAGQNINRGGVPLAPLLLFTTGSGQIVPFHDGQMLEVGHRYVMTAVLERGYGFTNWNPVIVFTFVERILDESGNIETVTNIVTSPVPRFTERRALMFEMQPEVVIYDSPTLTIIRGVGWQANFVAVQKDDLNPPVSSMLPTETVSSE
jgi:hypothetical protein